MKHYAVFGQPIAHSLSPRIHAAFAAQCGIELEYRAIESGREGFAHVLDEFARAGGVGANVTLPLKEDAFALCAARSERAMRCGSVNTLIRDDGQWRGDSTDGSGLLRDLRERHGFEPRERRVLLLGAGGAARAAAFALVDAGVRELLIANRSNERASALAQALGACAAACAFDHITERGAFDLVINATAAGHGGGAFTVPAPQVQAHTFAYDLSYGKAAQPFLDWARSAGIARSSDGLGMLVEQAADAFELWHGLRPVTASVYAMLRT